jgi:arabinose-5-phosphate isomerase
MHLSLGGPLFEMNSAIIEQVKEVLKIEAEAVLGLLDRVDSEFERAVRIIKKSKGRVILTGMGKSGLVARKISATLNSTGTPSLFLHPAEAIHGDLGMVARDDVILAISQSGKTSEINTILPLLRKMGAKIIAFTGVIDSTLAQESDVVIDVGVEREACPMGLAPTASTTAALAMGDALAVVLINLRRFDSKDFRKFHPGGSLGERLAVKVRDVMFTEDHIPMILAGSKVEMALREIDAKGIGAAMVVDGDRKLRGIVTDGDLRRALLKHKNIHSVKVEQVMSPAPRTVEEEQTAAEALGIMELYQITHLCIVNRDKTIKGVVHLHDLLGREEFRLNGVFKGPPRSHRRPRHPA